VCGFFRFRLTVLCYHFRLNAFPSLTKYVGVLLILFSHVLDMNLLLFNLLLCADCTLVVVHYLDGMWYIVLSGSTNCSINDLIDGHFIINCYIRNSVDETTLDCVAFLRELIMNDVISHVCTS